MSAVVHFSTDDISPPHRLAVWREALFQTEFNVDIEPISDSPFRARAMVRTLPGLRVLSGRSSPATYQRMTKRVVSDDVALSFGNEVHVSARPNGREAVIETGDAFLCLAATAPASGCRMSRNSRACACRAQRSPATSPISKTPIAAEFPAIRRRSCC